jgi:PAS domain S-box-containing protein
MHVVEPGSDHVSAPCVVVRPAGAEPAPWERGMGEALVSLTPAELRDAQLVLKRSNCALLDATLADVLEEARRIRELEPPLQVLIVAAADVRPRIEHTMLFTPGLGDVWVVEPAQVRPELLHRARAVTAHRRAYHDTRSRRRAAVGARVTSRTHISDAYLAALLSVLPDAVISIDPEDRILSWNGAAERVFGVSGDTPAPQSLHDVFVAEEPAALARLLAAAATDAPARGEFAFHAGGEAHVAEVSVIPVEAAGYRVRAVVVHEITQERRGRTALEAQAEELRAQRTQLADTHHELELANAELREAFDALAERTGEAERARAEADSANRAKTDFLATMSHEIRTPINAIIGYTELLEIGLAGPLEEKQRGFLARVRFSSRHLLTLIEDILDLARIEAGRTQLSSARVSAAAVVGAAIALVGPQAHARRIRLRHATLEDRLTTFDGDEDRVRQILVNLLSNAIKFTEPGGRVTVNHGVTATAPPIVTGRGGPWTFIQITDTGVGIAPADLERVFLPFEQADQGYTRRKGGTGLGLAISRQLARLMGGELTADSELGRGSTFMLWLPHQPTYDDAAQLSEGAATR